MTGIIIVAVSVFAAAYLIIKKILCARCPAFSRDGDFGYCRIYFTRSFDYG